MSVSFHIPQPLRPRFLAVAFLLAAPLAGRGTVFAAEELLFSDSPVPIAKHEVRPTQVRIYQSQDSDVPMVTATQFGVDVSNRPTGAGSYDVLPLCTESAVHRAPLGESTPGSERVDVLYFSPDEPEQVKLAGKYPGLAVPFVDSAMVNPYYGGYNRLQCFARTIHITCLPTRFRYATIDGSYVSEYRTGARAWDEK